MNLFCLAFTSVKIFRKYNYVHLTSQIFLFYAGTLPCFVLRNSFINMRAVDRNLDNFHINSDCGAATVLFKLRSTGQPKQAPPHGAPFYRYNPSGMKLLVTLRSVRSEVNPRLRTEADRDCSHVGTNWME
jgi:hypothetical protein